jgi:hypothetical protein
MNLMKNIIFMIILAFVVSFAQQSTASKSISQVSSSTITVAKVDTQKQLKSISGTKTTNTTWTKIKDLFM